MSRTDLRNFSMRTFGPAAFSTVRGFRVVATLAPFLCLLLVYPRHVYGAAPAGNAVSVTIGYLEALSNHDSFYIQGATAVFASDNMFLGVVAEAPTFWKSLYPVVVTKWMMHNRYARYHIDNRINTQGFLLCAGLGYGFDAWQSTVRLQASAGYWWESVDADFRGLFEPPPPPFEINNDEPALMLGGSLACPFAGRVNMLVSCELVARSTKEVTGNFPNGRSYRLETNGTSGTVSVGFVVGLGSVGK